jgi:hypothetical protein
MSYEPGRRCEVCGGESPRVPVCGECEVAARLGKELDELARYREREQLVEELLEAWNLWTGQEMYGELFREGMVPSDFEAWEGTVDAVRTFCITSASTPAASAGNAAVRSGKEPAE